MKPVNIYALTRIFDPLKLERLERQMSKRNRYLKIKEWEIEGLRAFCDQLNHVMETAPELDFYYSFVMPKLGKEFDLLRINDEYVVNIELKSGNVTDDAILKQLLQNRYYLATLGKNMYSYTYVSENDRLVRLSNGGRLIETSWEDFARILEKQTDCYDGNIEELFKEDKYLISPLTDPGRFLRQEYFLTSQQKDIRRQILKTIRQDQQNPSGNVLVQGFTGLPGTGKTILLYDIAMQLSISERICVFHFGSHAKELEQLDERLKRVDFYYCDKTQKIETEKEYAAILVDEGHRITQTALTDILELAARWKAPVIFSYDKEDAIAKEERKQNGADLIEALSGYQKYKLTNRIRLNSELSAFIGCVMCARDRGHRREYPSVSLVYAGNDEEAGKLLHKFRKEGYIYIWDNAIKQPAEKTDRENPSNRIETAEATCREFERVVMLLDDTFYYDAGGNLRAKTGEDEHTEDHKVRKLFHGLSRAKKNIALVIRENEPVFDILLSILQHENEK